MFAHQESTQDLVLALSPERSNSGLLARESALKDQLGRTRKSIFHGVASQASTVFGASLISRMQPETCSRKTDISLVSHIETARAAIVELRDRERRTERNRAYEQALAWLDSNRERYAGQWIALRGSELLANGMSAREVHSSVFGQQPPVLILRIEPEELPFAGW